MIGNMQKRKSWFQSAWAAFCLCFMSYLKLLELILKLENMNLCSLHIYPFSNAGLYASQNRFMECTYAYLGVKMHLSGPTKKLDVWFSHLQTVSDEKNKKIHMIRQSFSYDQTVGDEKKI